MLLRRELNLWHKHGQLSENEQATPNHRHVCQETNSRKKTAPYSTRVECRVHLGALGVSLGQPDAPVTFLIRAGRVSLSYNPLLLFSFYFFSESKKIW